MKDEPIYLISRNIFEMLNTSEWHEGQECCIQEPKIVNNLIGGRVISPEIIHVTDWTKSLIISMFIKCQMMQAIISRSYGE